MYPSLRRQQQILLLLILHRHLPRNGVLRRQSADPLRHPGFLWVKVGKVHALLQSLLLREIRKAHTQYLNFFLLKRLFLHRGGHRNYSRHSLLNLLLPGLLRLSILLCHRRGLLQRHHLQTPSPWTLLNRYYRLRLRFLLLCLLFRQLFILIFRRSQGLLGLCFLF